MIGTLKGKGPFEVRMAVDGAAQPLVWNVPPAQPTDDNSYLKRLVDVGAANGGLTLPLVGSDSLKQAERVIGAGANQSGKPACGRAWQSGDVQGAQKMAQQALAEDPTNPVAQAAAAAAGKRAGGKAPAEAGPDLNLTAPQPEGEMAETVAREAANWSNKWCGRKSKTSSTRPASECRSIRMR